MKKTLNISPTVQLPEDAITQKSAFLGRSGSGKTYAAGKMVEEMLDLHAQVVILDPVGVWNGLRTSADGKAKGYSIPVFGGEHADLPLPHTSGSILANLIVEKGISAVLDVSWMRKNERKQFVTDFAEQLFHLKKKHRSPMHLVMEEAQVFVPQRVIKGEERMLGAMEDIVKLGRNYGIGISLISQRPQSVHKDCLNQTEALFAFQINGPHERNAIKDWIVDKGLDKSTVGEDLSGLPTGTCFLWSPQWLRILKKIEISKKKTFDASATPLVGKSKKTIARELAPVDLEEIKSALDSTIVQVKENDPKELKKKISELNAELSKLKSAAGKVQPVKPDTRIEGKLNKILQDIQRERKEYLKGFISDVQTFGFKLTGVFEDIKIRIDKFKRTAEVELERIEKAHLNVTSDPNRPNFTFENKDNKKGRVTISGTPFKAHIDFTEQVSSYNGFLGKCERAILVVLAQRVGTISSRAQVSVLSGYSKKSSSFVNALGKLRTSGYIIGRGDELQITDSGTENVGDFQPLPTGKQLHEYWYGKLGKCEAAILKVLIERYPDRVAKEDVAELSGYSITSSSFVNALGALRSLELIYGKADMTAASVLFE